MELRDKISELGHYDLSRHFLQASRRFSIEARRKFEGKKHGIAGTIADTTNNRTNMSGKVCSFVSYLPWSGCCTPRDRSPKEALFRLSFSFFY